MMFADMIRTDLIAARMRTCISYNICKWASFYLLAIFFFPSSPLCWCHLCCGSTAMTASPCHQHAQVLTSSWTRCWNRHRIGRSPCRRWGKSCCSFYFCCSISWGSAPQFPFLELACKLVLPELGWSNISSGKGLSGSWFWDPVTHLHGAEQLSSAPAELTDPMGTANSQPSTSEVAVASQAAWDEMYSLGSEP